MELVNPKPNWCIDIFCDTVCSGGVLFSAGQSDIFEFCRVGQLRKTAEKRGIFKGFPKYSDIFRNCRSLVGSIVIMDGIRLKFEHSSQKLDKVMLSVSADGSHCIGGDGMASDIPLSRHIEPSHGIIWS